jgi:galactokinase
MDYVKHALQLLEAKFQREAEVTSRAPGRVNIIGEHTDYNDGFVMPIATDAATYTSAAPRDDRLVRVFSTTMGEQAEFSLDDLQAKGAGHWADYLQGVAWSLGVDKHELRGVDAVIVSDVPAGSGMSSSAALEVSWALAMLGVAGQRHPDKKALALACQRAENEFVGMKCGIMDQLASILGERDSAILLDCWTLEHEAVPLPADALTVVVMDTGKPRQLVGSEYNTRVSQCKAASDALGVRALRDATMEDLEAAKDKMEDIVYRRARHVICEDERVFEVAEALREEDYAHVGDMLNQSHASLKDDYEVSVAELDLICEVARAQEGCYGARLVGAGFGGCAMALVRTEAAEAFAPAVKAEYDRQVDYVSRIFSVKADQGAGLV